MTNLETRIKILEKKLSNDDNLPDCIIICSESARINAEPDTSKIIRLTTNDKIYDRKSGESEEDFVLRVAESAKAMLPLPSAVPCLLAITEKSLADNSS